MNTELRNNLIIGIICFICGWFICHNYFPKVEYVVSTIETTTPSKEAIQTDIGLNSKNNNIIEYVSKEEVVVNGKNYKEITDVEANIAKPNLNVSVNGNKVEIPKKETEKFVFDDGKLVLNQKSDIEFKIKTEPVKIDNTKHFAVGIMTNKDTTNKIYTFEFPLVKKLNIDGEVAYSTYNSEKYAGIKIRF